MSVLIAAEDDVAVPSWPEALTRTGWVGPAIEAPLMPAMNAEVWLPTVPMRIVRDSAATPRLAMSTLFAPVVRFSPARNPTAMLSGPVVLVDSAWVPWATLLAPVVLAASAPVPTATPLLPVVLACSALTPPAKFDAPVA